MSEIWTIALTRNGMGACVLNQAAEAHFCSEKWTFSRQSGCDVVDSAVIIDALKQCMRSLMEAGHELPSAIAVTSESHQTAVFCDERGDCVSPCFFNEPLTIPRSDIPDRYAGSAELAVAYRNSILRRIQQVQPEFGLGQQTGIMSIGALVLRAMTGRCVCSCMPFGVPAGFPGMNEDAYQACGLSRASCMAGISSGTPAGRITLHFSEMLEMPEIKGIPVFDMGSAEGSAAYASVANPLSWCVGIGGKTRAFWNAGASSLSAFEIQVLPKGLHAENEACAEEQSCENTEEMTGDEWTRLFNERQKLRVYPGPGRALSAFGLESVNFSAALTKQAIHALIEPETGIIPYDVLTRAPLGSGGLHVFSHSTGLRVIGLCEAHENVHLARACFEGQMYGIRQWREQMLADGMGPVRLVLSPPWPEACVQLAADILNAPVIWIEHKYEHLSAFGASLALMRMLEIEMYDKPRIHAQIVEPGQRAAYYLPHYRVHQQLQEGL